MVHAVGTRNAVRVDVSRTYRYSGGEHAASTNDAARTPAKVTISGERGRTRSLSCRSPRPARGRAVNRFPAADPYRRVLRSNPWPGSCHRLSRPTPIDEGDHVRAKIGISLAFALVIGSALANQPAAGATSAVPEAAAP